MIKLSVSETKWSSLLARTGALILYISIGKFDFGPESYRDFRETGPRSQIPSNHVHTEGAIESVRINGVSVLIGLNLEKM